MPVHRMTRLILGVPNVAATEAYYAEFGLSPLGDGRFATVDGGEQLQVVHSQRRRAVEVGIGVDDPDDLDRIVHSLAALGANATRETDAVLAEEPFTGVRVRVEIAPRIEQAPREPVPMNGPGLTSRHNQRAVNLGRDAADLKPRKLGHVVLGSTNQPASQEFFVNGIGFKISDLIKDAGGFLRCSTDHHNLLVIKAPAQFLHHTSWQVPDVDAVGEAALKMIEKDEDRNVWGLGRHYVGSNFFWYLKDPAGNFSEYYADMDVIDNDAEWTPEVWEGQYAHYYWAPKHAQTMNPQDLVAAMIGAHA
jgi:hypothetical protein